MSLLLHIAERVLNRPLLVHPDKVPLILNVLQGRLPIGDVSAMHQAAEARIAELPEQARAALLGATPEASRFVGEAAEVDPETGRARGLPYRRTSEGVAVITVLGALANRGVSLERTSFSKQSYEGIKFQIGRAAADPKTHAILLDIESPGGEAVGAFEAADAVRAAAATKPVYAVVNGMAASAAYAIASAATKIVTTPTGVSGSIGVVLLHGDFSRALDKQGITPTLIFAGAHKVDGNPFEPLSEAVHADLQAEVNSFYDMFVETVAKGRRGMSAKAIRETEARTLIGAEAVKAGLADDVGTFESVLADLTRASGRTISQTRSTRMSETKTAPDANSGTIAKADHDKAVADARTAGATEERARIQSILGLEEAKGREKAALAIAMTGATVDQAKAVLAVSPKEQAEAPKSEKKGDGERASETVLGMVVDQPQAHAAKAGWGKATERANRSRGFAQ